MLQYRGKTAIQEKDLQMFDVNEEQIAGNIQKSIIRSEKFEDPNKSASKSGNWVLLMVVAACFLSAIVFFIGRKIELSQINAESSAIEMKLDDARQENSRLKAKLEGLATPAIIEEYAREAGLVKAHNSQITYITVDVENAVEVAPEPPQDFFSKVGRLFDSVLEFLGFA